MTMATDFRCDLCGKPINPNHPLTWHGMKGYERRAGQRLSGKQGGSDITLREQTDGFAHDLCIRLAKAGIPPDQETLC